MFGRNRQVNLFREFRIDNFLNEKEIDIKKKIGRYSDSTLATINVEIEIEKLIDSANLVVPNLKKEKTKTSITTEKMTGKQLPSGTRFEMGRNYDIEIANYNIPFNGNKEFFKCYPSKNISFRPLSVELQEGLLTIKLTNWLNGISGKDEVIDMLKNELINYVESIELVLTQLQEDIDGYKTVLEKKMRIELETLIKKVNIKNESNDKLNPF